MRERQAYRTANVLVVTEDDATLLLWREWLEEAGYVTATCSGPRVHPQCPRLAGDRCALREAVDLALIDLPGHAEERCSEQGELACRKIPDDSRSVFIHDGACAGARQGFHLARPVPRAALVAVADQPLLLRP